MSRVYANVNATLGPRWYDYDSFQIEWSSPERYEIVGRVGGGKYSEVRSILTMSIHAPSLMAHEIRS